MTLVGEKEDEYEQLDEEYITSDEENDDIYVAAKESNELMDLEDLGSYAAAGLKAAKQARDEDQANGVVINRKKGTSTTTTHTREMLTPNLCKNSEKQGYKLIVAASNSTVALNKFAEAATRIYHHKLFPVEMGNLDAGAVEQAKLNPQDSFLLVLDTLVKFFASPIKDATHCEMGTLVFLACLSQDADLAKVSGLVFSKSTKDLVTVERAKLLEKICRGAFEPEPEDLIGAGKEDARDEEARGDVGVVADNESDNDEEEEVVDEEKKDVVENNNSTKKLSSNDLWFAKHLDFMFTLFKWNTSPTSGVKAAFSRHCNVEANGVTAWFQSKKLQRTPFPPFTESPAVLELIKEFSCMNSDFEIYGHSQSTAVPTAKEWGD
ncbi:hypothetical protein BCR33DRAFT_855406 [Rhizoclosmatium globosum]|uniref:Homeobox domain-containing protein n=1 Tax=Rhizoclosmatium globosum TaxID=329046 RepID=A0A1Y2BMZ0_9FUNG|nr:hypothetical protein BCR33DRAFT_855406 [Rhizoclosmatium globosum]|eukprot:ORY36134.1 hypothetical protein BCR33DRAFT_855406 [Rhizoclosmatium globosum]